MTTDTRPTKAQFKRMPKSVKRALITPTIDGEPLTAEQQASYKARMVARRKQPFPKAKVANGRSKKIKPASVSTTGGAA